jgi:hypothetical protein
MPKKPVSIGHVALWLAIGVLLVTAIACSWDPTPFAQALAGVFIACALIHAAVFYDARAAAMLFAICLVITFAMENLGTTTGFPFGHYHFEVGAALPHVGRIPIIDAAGAVWRVHDLRETTVAILIFTMVFSGLLAALRLAREAGGSR